MNSAVGKAAAADAVRAPRSPAASAAGAWHSEDMRSVSPVLVGRAKQLAVLDAALAPARREGPSVVLIGGEAGVGESPLVSGVTARARANGARVLTRGCVGPGAHPPPV